VPIYVDPSTQQAADLLTVFHSHLVGLLDAGAISCQEVGGHTQVDTALGHLRIDDLRQQRAADELSRLTRNWT
jgi:hypothetical protein